MNPYRNLYVQSDTSILRSLNGEKIPVSPGKMHLVSYLCLVPLQAPLPSGSFTIALTTGLCNELEVH